MYQLRYLGLLGILLFFSQSRAANIINLGVEFDQFLTATQDLPKDKVETEWERFESKHQFIYDRYVYRKDAAGWEQRLRNKRDQFFSQLPVYKEDMKALFASADKVVAEKEAAFRAMFPDLASDIPVYFLPSLRSFNGKVGPLPEFGRSGLMMGVDFIVERKDDMDVLFSHEFFHAYQDDKIEGTSGQTMATPLWFEGFATYVSGVLNPDRSDTVLLMAPDLATECGKSAFVKDLAKQYLTIINTDGQTTYADWFMMSGTIQPTRRGYCLGLHVMRRLAQTYAPTEMVRWAEERFSKEINTVLQEMAK